MSAPLGSCMYICCLLVSYNHDLSGVSLETASALKKRFCQVKSTYLLGYDCRKNTILINWTNSNKINTAPLWIPIKQMVYVVKKFMVSDLVGLKSNQKFVVHGLCCAWFIVGTHQLYNSKILRLELWEVM